MNQLIKSDVKFDFLTQAGLSMEDIQTFVWEVWEHSLMQDDYNLTPYADSGIPSKFLLYETAMDNYFDQYYVWYGLADPESHAYADIQCYSDDYDEDELLDAMRETRIFNTSYIKEIPEYSCEHIFMKDISTALQLFHLTYFKDDTPNNHNPLFERPDNFKLEEWINPPIVGVW